MGRAPIILGLTAVVALAATSADARPRKKKPAPPAPAASALWTYAWSDCALLVYFKSPDGRTLRVSGASAGPRRRGQATPTVDACIAQNHDKPRDAKASEAIDALLANPG